MSTKFAVEYDGYPRSDDLPSFDWVSEEHLIELIRRVDVDGSLDMAALILVREATVDYQALFHAH